MKQIHIPRYVLTGGPCGGKTSSLSSVVSNLVEKGFTVFIVPEAATILISMGISPISKDFQEQVLSCILFLEDQAYRQALVVKKQGKNPIIICDRGALDGLAYVSPVVFDRVVKKSGHSMVDIRDKRYDAIFHLVTAANGAADYYTLENNQARQETPEQAIVLDTKTQHAWVGHPHLKVIDNTIDFESKKKRVLDSLFHSLGIPVPLEIEYKYLIDSSFSEKDIPKNIHRVTLDVVQHYLQSNNQKWEERVRKRGEGANNMYTYTLKRPTLLGNSRFEKERIITYPEYVRFLERQDPLHVPIFKSRTCFLYENQYFELDKMKKPMKGRTYSEIEVTDVQENVQLPQWLPVIENVTGKKEHSMKSLSLKV